MGIFTTNFSIFGGFNSFKGFGGNSKSGGFNRHGSFQGGFCSGNNKFRQGNKRNDFRNSYFNFHNWNFHSGDIVSRFIYLNVGVFVFVTLVNLFLTLLGVHANPWMKYLQLPSWLPTFFFQPWSLVTYMFLHVGLFHLLFNMLWLLWFGRLFLNFFSSKHFRGLYVLGGIYGGLSFVLAYNILPGFEASLPNASLLGASASVLAVVIATAVREPDLPVQFMFLGSVRLKFVALCMVAFDLLFISYDNAGGHIAHLGGAAAGWFFAAGLAKGVDRTRWINDIIDLFSGKLNINWRNIFNWYKRINWKQNRNPKMKVHYGDRQKDYDFNAQKNAQKKERQEELNLILDKLRKSGYGSLTDDEKRRLFDASKQ